MSIWLVRRSAEFVEYDELAGIVVLAESAHDAIRVAQCEAQDEGPDAWCNAEVILVGEAGPAMRGFLGGDVVLKDKRAG